MFIHIISLKIKCFYQGSYASVRWRSKNFGAKWGYVTNIFKFGAIFTLFFFLIFSLNLKLVIEAHLLDLTQKSDGKVNLNFQNFQFKLTEISGLPSHLTLRSNRAQEFPLTWETRLCDRWVFFRFLEKIWILFLVGRFNTLIFPCSYCCDT